MDRYAVIGNPVAHSLSPAIHARFAAQCGDDVRYTAIEAPRDGFRACVERFFAQGARGANVTLPFKVEAFEWAAEPSPRAREAGAANFLEMRDGRVHCDNTDGAGLVADLRDNIGAQIRGSRVLLLGAGGAARGVIGPLLAQSPLRLVIANRDAARAGALAARFADRGPLGACGLGEAGREDFDIVVNATSASTLGAALGLPEGVLHAGVLAYDMAYGRAAEAFLARARASGARASDGLGMLVEQAAESWRLWRGRRPATAEVLAALRAEGR